MKRGAVITAIVILGGLAAAGGGLAWWKYHSIQKAMAGGGGGGFEPAESVSVVEVQTKPWYPTAKLVGSVFAIQSIVLSNEIAGTVKEVRFESGAIAEPGQVLLTMDTVTEEADLAAAQANVKVAQANIEVALAEVRSMQSTIKLAESDARRMEQAVRGKAASEMALDKANADVEQAQAKLVQATSNVERSKSELEQSAARVLQLQALIEKKTLKAPFRARLGIRSVHPGQYLPEGTRLVELQGVSAQTYLDFAIPQDDAWRIKPGQVVPARSVALGEGLIPITVQAIDAAVDRSTRNVRVRSIVPNPGEKLRPGTFVDVEVPLGDMQNLIMVPAVAVRRASYGDHVFVVIAGDKPTDAQGALRVKQKFIKVGPTVGQDLVIESGLAVGDRIAASGAFKLRDGALIAVQPARDGMPGVGGATGVGGTGGADAQTPKAAAK